MATPSKKESGATAPDIFSAPMDYEQFAEVGYTAFNTAGEIGRRWYTMVNEINGELIRFVSGRLREDTAIGPALATCRDSEDLFRLCSEYYRDAVNQYFDEAEKLAHIGADFASKATKLVEDETREVHDIASD